MSIQQLFVVRRDLPVADQLALVANASSASIFWNMAPKLARCSNGDEMQMFIRVLDPRKPEDVAYSEQIRGNVKFDTKIVFVDDHRSLAGIWRQSRGTRELWDTRRIDVTGQLFDIAGSAELGCVAIGPYPSDVIQELVDNVLPNYHKKETEMKEL